MNILVCISKSPDTTSKIAFTEGNTKFDENGVQYIVNPYDEWYSLVRALELKETIGGNVTIITVGNAGDERSEERRVGKECRYRWREYDVKNKKTRIQITVRIIVIISTVEEQKRM